MNVFFLFVISNSNICISIFEFFSVLKFFMINYFLYFLALNIEMLIDFRSLKPQKLLIILIVIFTSNLIKLF